MLYIVGTPIHDVTNKRSNIPLKCCCCFFKCPIGWMEEFKTCFVTSMSVNYRKYFLKKKICNSDRWAHNWDKYLGTIKWWESVFSWHSGIFSPIENLLFRHLLGPQYRFIPGKHGSFWPLHFIEIYRWFQRQSSKVDSTVLIKMSSFIPLFFSFIQYSNA